MFYSTKKAKLNDARRNDVRNCSRISPAMFVFSAGLISFKLNDEGLSNMLITVCIDCFTSAASVRADSRVSGETLPKYWSNFEIEEFVISVNSTNALKMSIG